MSAVLNKLQKLGQCLSGQLAKHCGMSVRSIDTALYPHVASGKVMACKVFDGNGKLAGIEYRMTGSFPRSRPGPKPT